MNEALRWLLNLPEQRSSIARSIDYLHYSVILATFAGVFVVALTTIIFVVKYRRRDGDRLTPHITAPRWLEATVIIGLLTLFVAWWVVGFSQYREIETAPADAMPVYVTAKQWMWKFAYPSGPTSTDVLTVPVGRPVKLIMSSRDVIHSFFVPAFRVKQDVVPGRATTLWFTATAPGTYDLECSQYCGTRHSFMRGQVVALSPADFARWLDAAEPDHFGGKGGGHGLAARGMEVAARHGCFRCHTIDGGPSIGPTWLGAFGRRRLLSGGGSVLVDEDYITESMMDPLAKIAAGFQPVMPTYQGAIQPADTAAIVELIRSLHDVPPTRDQLPPTKPAVMP
ncbi:MAG TPA: cytochrome c oxidase subunit II [Kofleriaceae bacterium]